MTKNLPKVSKVTFAGKSFSSSNANWNPIGRRSKNKGAEITIDSFYPQGC